MPRKKKVVKGYKVFNSDWTCRGFKFKVGEEYKMDDDIEVCRRGFHFCKDLNDCFEFYAFDPKNKVAEVKALGKVKNKKGDIKSVTNHIKIIKELSWFEVCDLVNTGKNNTGRKNSGDWNSGNRNSGNWNSGNRNSGDWNSGYCNSGDCNSGDWNSGYCNSGNRNSGIFGNKNSKIAAFNKSTDLTMDELKAKYEVAMNAIIYGEFPLTKWISKSEMSEKEKKEFPSYKTTGGYLRVNSYQEAWAIAWSLYSDKEKQAIQELPNFDKEVFRDITGIEV